MRVTTRECRKNSSYMLINIFMDIASRSNVRLYLLVSLKRNEVSPSCKNCIRCFRLDFGWEVPRPCASSIPCVVFPLRDMLFAALAPVKIIKGNLLKETRHGICLSPRFESNRIPFVPTRIQK